jgi:hypothetical protein
MQGRRSFSAIRKKHFSSQPTTVSATTSTNVTSNTNDDDRDDNNDEKVLQLVKKISDRLETGLNEYALRAIMDLLQRGEHPDAIVAAVTSLSQRAATSAAKAGTF